MRDSSGVTAFMLHAFALMQPSATPVLRWGARKQEAGNGAVFVHSRYAYQTKLAGRNHPVLRLYESHLSFHCYVAALPRLLDLTPFLPLLSDYEKCVPPASGKSSPEGKRGRKYGPAGQAPWLERRRGGKRFVCSGKWASLTDATMRLI